jgi:hypothetical protein
MSAVTKYVLDANAFIQTKRRFYPLDICPGYWKSLIWHHEQGTVCSIDRVREELERGGDDLWAWIKHNLPKDFFASTDNPQVIACYRQVLSWVQAQDQFLPGAKAELAQTDRADAWLIAYAKATGMVLVTFEEYDPRVRKRVPIPNVCHAPGIDVKHVTLFDMLRGLGTTFNWQPPTSAKQHEFALES